MRRLHKPGRRRCLYLSDEAFEILKHFSNKSTLSISEFVEILANNYQEKSDPIETMKGVETKVKTLKDQIEKLEKERESSVKELEWKKIGEETKQIRIKNTIELLKEKIINNYPQDEIEQFAQHHAFRLGIDAYELIYRAGKEVLNLKNG